MNLITDCPGFLCTELLYQPLLWVVGMFAVITAANAVTKRDNVARDGAGAIVIGYGHPMIHSQRMPKSRRSTTSGTTAVEMVKGVLPISLSEVIGQLRLSRKVTMRFYAEFFSIVMIVSSLLLFVFFRVFGFPLPNSFCMVWVISLNASLAFALLFKVPLSPITARLSALISVFFAPLAVVFALLNGIAGSFIGGICAGLASRAQSALDAFVTVEVFQSCWEFVTAHCAALKGYVILALHIEPPFGVPSPRLLAQRWDSLFTSLIIPQKRHS